MGNGNSFFRFRSKGTTPGTGQVTQQVWTPDANGNRAQRRLAKKLAPKNPKATTDDTNEEDK